MMYKELTQKLISNDIKFDYFINNIRLKTVIDKNNKNKPCAGCIDCAACMYCKYNSSILYPKGIVFVVNDNHNYYEYEFIIKMLDIMKIDYSNIGIVEVNRNIIDNYTEANVCNMNTFQREDDVYKPVKYICISDEAHNRLKELFTISQDSITIGEREVEYFKIMDIENLITNYEDSKNIFLNQFIAALRG